MLAVASVVIVTTVVVSNELPIPHFDPLIFGKRAEVGGRKFIRPQNSGHNSEWGATASNSAYGTSRCDKQNCSTHLKE